MKNLFKNTGYFLKETLTIVRLNLFSNILSLFSTGLILFILAMIISGWWVSNHVIQIIQNDAEINVFFDKNIGDNGSAQLVEKIKQIPGVRESRIVDESEAYQRMVKILGEESKVLKIFDDNPFTSYIEVKINLNEITPVLKEIKLINGIEYVRDNKAILDRLKSIESILRLIGLLVVAAVGITTLVIISHIIRLGIHSNKEQINTLRLLGAPETFIAFPFVLEGLLLTFGGGILATFTAIVSLKQIYAKIAAPLPFIPLPPSNTIISSISLILLTLSIILGLFGSMHGISTAKEQ